jgi:hypothetical protein
MKDIGKLIIMYNYKTNEFQLFINKLTNKDQYKYYLY